MHRLSFALVCLASPVLAEIDVRALVIEVARASNCMVTDEIAESTFPQLGLTQDDVGPVVQDMVLAGEGEVIDNAFHLSDALCNATAAEPAGEVAPVPAEEVQVIPPVSPLMGRVVEVFHANGCTMTEEQGLPALLAAGITEEDLATLSEESDALVEAGLMIRDETTYTITIVEPLCSGATVASDPAEPLIQMLSEHGCALTQDAAAALVSNYGITMGEADEMADSLMSRGLATVEGDKLTLANCGQ